MHLFLCPVCSARDLLLLFGSLKSAGQYDVPTMRWLCSAAAPLDAAQQGKCAAALSVIVRQGYGATETCPTVCLGPTLQVVLGSVGRALPITTFIVVDEEDCEVALGERGELCVKGPQVFVGYKNNPEATAASLPRGVLDGYFKLGDLAWLDGDDNVFLGNRIKEMIKVRYYHAVAIKHGC